MTITWITGARGFIGQYLSRYLAKQGDHVFGLGHGAYPPEISTKFGIIRWINGEIDATNLRQLLDVSGYPSTIYHLAGGSSVGLSIQTPTEDFRRSVVSTAALLDWIRTTTPETRLVVSSSAAIYGDTKIDPIPEEGTYIPYSPYGFHKRASELLCESYTQNFGLNIAIVRLFSIYGPGLCKQLLWDLCCRLKEAPDVLNLQGTGREIRDWLYVEDAVNILVAAGQSSLDVPLILNGGTGIGTSVKSVTDLLCKHLHLSPQITFSGQQKAGDPFSLVADISKLQALNIPIQYSLTTGLEKYANWFQSLK
jgi:UDP-glucose 4-epimerase